MNNIRIICSIAVADFLDRIRNKGILITIMIIMYISYLFVPDKGATAYFTLKISSGGYNYRGIYNSQWLGVLSTVCFIIVFSLIGFYIAKNCIKREINLGIGQISATSSVQKWKYIIGKVLSNVMYLSVTLIAVLVTIIMLQLVRGESSSINIVSYLLPYIVFIIPLIVIISTIAVIFEIIPFLRGTIGNIAYFFLWAILIAKTMESNNSLRKFDLTGVSTIVDKIIIAVKKIVGADVDSMIGYVAEPFSNMKTFLWSEQWWELNLIPSRLLWILITLSVLLPFIIIFNRRDLAKKVRLSKSNKKKSSKLTKTNIGNAKKDIVLTKYENSKNRFRIFKMIYLELLKVSKGLPKFWYVFMISINIISIIFMNNNEIVRRLILPINWIMPLFLWSRFSIIEKSNNTECYTFACNFYRVNQFFTIILSGVIFTIFMNLGLIISFALKGSILSVVYIVLGSVFIIAMAFFIGSSVGNSTIYELIYIIIWYVGILNQMPYLDFLGITQNSQNMNVPFIFFIISVIMITLSYFQRVKRLKNMFN